ncbi:MAG: 2-amino-4-hydroxy-6-hydroxymethyldihydropteridine diphosphokinase [Mizugakiibacter sp.]|uniref:2-amino-4-hydroxy-6- hydroxymethyldihydropteridine diphosphokinase n=1 Tax=Mizugakiibacter sp. TaxID=1972610 RepID=UPI0031C9F672|nr:2-amino-4-hydroxy-6-hydroxymethyldihydropteridine diphosphokinase [Xanthomonadaceae bacterium]
MTPAYVALGSNLGDPRAQVLRGLGALAGLPQTRLLRRSPLYLTPPWGIAEQPAFVNAVAALETELSPQALLQALLGIERACGRDRSGPRWGPRTLDLDLLLYGDRVLREDDLTLPHPRLAERAFVLRPLADLAPSLHVPGQGRVDALLARVDASGCVPLADA